MSATENAPGPGGSEKEPAAPINVDDLMEKFDREARYLRISGLWATVVKIIAVGFSLFQLYTALFGVLEAQIQRPTHLMFALALIYLLYPTIGKSKTQRKVHPFDLGLAILSCALGLYSILNYESLMESAGIYSDVDFVMGILGIILTLEATRRIVGLPIVIIAGCFLLYAYLGPYFPGSL